MAYTPKTWNCGDSITIADMNRIESGVAQMSGGGGYLEPLLISFDHYETVDSNQVPYMDTTWQQAYDAFNEGRAVVVDYASMPSAVPVIGLAYVDDIYGDVSFNIKFGGDDRILYADSADGYLYPIPEYEYSR